MPFLAGSLSVRRYLVTEAPPATLEQTATLAMRRYSWRPIDDQRGEKESFGWVNPRNILDPMFTYEDVLLSPFVFLGVRRDRKAFSKVIFRARRDQRIAEIKREKKLEKITRQHRLAIEEELTVEMLKETSPTSAFNELVWDLNSNMLYMGATSNALCDRISDLFEATFDIKLRPLLPALIGADFISSQGLEEEYFAASAATQPRPKAAPQEESQA